MAREVVVVSLPKLNGIEAARQIRLVSPRSIILLLSAHSSPDIALEALRTGARGYVIAADIMTETTRGDRYGSGKRFLSDGFARHGLVW
jgi:DNA-binding NarL/FixJ family response regulator